MYARTNKWNLFLFNEQFLKKENYTKFMYTK